MGIILYIIFACKPPFNALDEAGIIENIKKANLDFSETVWIKVSPMAINFINRLLTKDP